MNGFQLVFPDCKHVLCFLHCRRNIQHELAELGICGAYARAFLTDIFSTQTGTCLTCGPVDANSEAEFNSALMGLESTWKQRENEARDTDSPKLFDWFLRYQASNMKTKTLLPLRQSFGLGQSKYSTNDNEHITSIIKKKVDYKAHELCVFCEQIKELVEEQKENIEQVFVMQTGPCTVDPKIVHLTKPPSLWTKLGKIAHEKHSHNIHTCALNLLPKILLHLH